MFTTPCFIRKNTPELMQKLWELGCHIHPTCRGIDIINPYVFAYRGYYAQSPIGRIEEIKWIDCGENEDLFLAVSALRDDTDKYQWFTDGKDWYLHESEVLFDDCTNIFEQYGSTSSLAGYHKATVEELIEHFNHEQDTQTSGNL